MAATKVLPQKLLKNSNDLERFSCTKCSSLLEDPVQIGCGHRLCKSCADELIASAGESTPKCPECKDDIIEEEGVKVYRTLMQCCSFNQLEVVNIMMILS